MLNFAQKMTTFLVLWCGLIVTIFGAIPQDEIKSLPGWSGSSFPSKQYSGLLEIPGVTPKRFYHYWFIQSQSNSPLNDPFIVWYNGGPGGSSLTGLLTEMGIFHLNDFSAMYKLNGIPQLWYNQYAWSTFANMLYIESPAGVGFSYCEGDEGPELSCPQWNDTLTAQDNYRVLKQFFKGYPEYLNNSQFYLTSESYGGVYVCNIHIIVTTFLLVITQLFCANEITVFLHASGTDFGDGDRE